MAVSYFLLSPVLGVKSMTIYTLYLTCYIRQNIFTLYPIVSTDAQNISDINNEVIMLILLIYHLFYCREGFFECLYVANI